jgi:exosome complex component RRP42
LKQILGTAANTPFIHSFTTTTNMAPQAAALVNLSPAELSFLRSSLAQTPPIRLDVTKGPRDFRSMRAEYDVLPGANGSARIALEDGTEALVGVKAEVERSPQRPSLGQGEDVTMRDESADESKGKGQNSWVEMSVEVPGFREDDSLPVFLASMLKESLLASGALKDRLYINRRFHWKLYVDVGQPIYCDSAHLTANRSYFSPRPSPTRSPSSP